MSDRYPVWLAESDFEVQCFWCRGKKGRTVVKKGTHWVLCPSCGASLDIMNRVRKKEGSGRDSGVPQGTSLADSTACRDPALVNSTSPPRAPAKPSKPSFCEKESLSEEK
jgi:hypothetical protein